MTRAKFVYSVGWDFRRTGSWVHVGPEPLPRTDATEEVNSPRAKYGTVIPFIFGTVQIRSPLCVYSGLVTKGNPFNWADPEDKEQYWNTLDLLLCERIHTDGVQVGTIRLRKIWYGQSLLWDGTGPAFTTPVTTSNNLLRHDPNAGDEDAIPGGGSVLFGQDVVGDGWWWGGIVGEPRQVSYPAGSPSFVPDQWRGNVLGGITKVWSGMWAQYLGLQLIDFYVGSGDEQPHGSIGSDIFGPADQGGLWNTDFQYIYPSYHKFSRLVFRDFIWGPEARIEDISAEVTVTCPASAIGDTAGVMANGLDVNPVSVLYTLLTHPDLAGGSKMPGVDVDSFSEARAIIAAEGMGMSCRLDTAEEASVLAEAILDHIDGDLTLDPTTGVVSLTLSRLVQTALPKFTDSHVTALKEISKTTWVATCNEARLKFELRGGSGNQMSCESTAVAKDPGLAQNTGATETFEFESRTIFDADVANEVVARALSEASVPLVKVQFSGTRELSSDGPSVSLMDLRPGSMFEQDFESLGVTDLRLRTTSVDLGTLDDNAVTVTAIQDIYQARAIIAPPEQTDRYTNIPPPTEVTIGTYRMFTAPYYFARAGLGPDARRVLTTAPVYQVDEDTAGKEFAVNYDRFMMLAKAPYDGATSFQWSLVNDDDATVYSATVPYTEAGTLTASVSSTVLNDDGILDSIEIEGLSLAGVALLTSGPDKMLMIGDELFLVSPANATAGEDGESVTIAPCERQILDSPELESHDIGDTVWILESWSSSWMAARLAPPLQSSVEEYWDFDAEAPTDGYLNDFQALLPAHALRIRNLDSSKTNFETEDTAVLQDRANRALPIRQVDAASSTATAAAAATSFVFDFEQLTSVARLYQQREIGSLVGVDNSFELLLPKLQDSADKWSAESFSGLLTEAKEDDFHHVLKLDVWYEYGSGPLAGAILRGVSDNPTPAGDGSVTFQASAEGTTRLITCYLRACFAPHVLGDAGYVPIRRSVVRTYRITLDRT